MNPRLPRFNRKILFFSMLPLVLIGACALGGWAAAQPSANRFLMPGSLDVQITETGVGQRLITYRMANPQDGWLTSTANRLQKEGWDPPTGLYIWGSTELYAAIYTRHVQVWRVIFWEQARLDGDARFAKITVRRWVEWR